VDKKAELNKQIMGVVPTLLWEMMEPALGTIPEPPGDPAAPSYEKRTLSSMIEQALTNPDSGQQEPDLPDLYGAMTTVREGKLFDLLAGASPQEISQRVSAGESPYYEGGREDLKTHSLTSQLLAERLGVPAARVLGTANEVGGGLIGLAKGEGFFGGTGFDLKDLNANEIGIEAYLEQQEMEKQARSRQARGR